MADAVEATGNSHDFVSLLSSSDRDYLIRNNGHQGPRNVRDGPAPTLVEVYKELVSNNDFEIIFITADEDDESFKEYFSKMPWLAIPFSDSETRDHLDQQFKVQGIPHLVILDEHGRVSTEDGVEIIQEYGVECYPFTLDKIKELKEQEEEAKRNQSLRSILVSGARDYLISHDGNKVPVFELEGKTVGLYFSLSSYNSCVDFTPKLTEVYEKLKAKGENFEVVLISLDDDEETFQQSFLNMPWLALPFKDKCQAKLIRYFELSTVPTLVVIGPDGKTLHTNVAEIIEEHGTEAYPFTPEKLGQLAEIEKAREAAQTLESVLVSGDLNFVVGKDGAKVLVSDLVGKNILLYFSAHWCPPCRAFLPKLIEAYNQIKEKDDLFEVIFISSDRDQPAFDEFFSTMPWLALPFGDPRKALLSRKFKVQGIPMLVSLGPTGKTITKEARSLIMIHGAEAYPFTEEHMKKIEEKYEEMVKGWPEKLKHPLHEEHELVLTRRMGFNCDGCDGEGNIWSFYCEECDFDLHPKCALVEDKGKKDGENGEPGSGDGWICDGDVCRKA